MAMVNDRNVDRVGTAIYQMQKLILRYLEMVMNGDLFDKAMECLNSLRLACVREDEGEIFN